MPIRNHRMNRMRKATVQHAGLAAVRAKMQAYLEELGA
jgi:hypothetical protein